ncbi:glycoside hydrolase family 75 protein [Pseudoduganella lutea]|nr:glycoside hydrolase family 75 protein [Pseudoduganella lutea]
MRIPSVLLAVMLGAGPPLSLAQICGNAKQGERTWLHKDAILFKNAVLHVDADGAPNSYLLDGNGLSYTCDGVVAIENGKKVTPKSDPKRWQEKCRAAWKNAKATGDYRGVSIFGFETNEKNVPLVQSKDDPLPGKAYISTTSYPVPGQPKGTQRRYVDATKIPYIVLPPSFRETHKIKRGTLAVVYRPKTGRHAFAVYGDSGSLGEASVKLHQDLGSDPMIVRDGVARAKAGIGDASLIAVFPNAVASPETNTEAWYASIQQEGATALESFGGLEVLKSCAR